MPESLLLPLPYAKIGFVDSENSWHNGNFLESVTISKSFALTPLQISSDSTRKNFSLQFAIFNNGYCFLTQKAAGAWLLMYTKNYLPNGIN
jgi:hypothetical protein